MLNQEKVPSPFLELKPFQRKMFALYGPEKEVCVWSLSIESRNCSRRYESDFGMPWSDGEIRGYTIAEVIVSIIPVTSKSSTDG